MYEVTDAQKVNGGTVVTFSYIVVPSWFSRILGKRPRRETIVAFTQGHTDWRYFPSLLSTTFDDWFGFNDAWNRYEILNKLGDE